MQAWTQTTAPAALGAKQLVGDPDQVKYFDTVAIAKNKPKIAYQALNSNNILYNKIVSVDRENGIINLETPLQVAVPAGSLVRRAPGYATIKQVLQGDVAVLNAFPSIIIAPQEMDREWITLPTGASETFNFNIIVYVKDEDGEKAMMTLMSATGELDDLLISDLHLRIPTEPGKQPGLLYDSRVTRINYGFVQKEATMLKAANITWYGKEWILRELVSRRDDMDHFKEYPGDAY